MCDRTDKPTSSGFYARRLTFDHRAEDEGEQERISAAGGFVTRGRYAMKRTITNCFLCTVMNICTRSNSRHLSYAAYHLTSAYYHSTIYRVLGILAVTRSFGDHGMKDFVTASPYLTETRYVNFTINALLLSQDLEISSILHHQLSSSRQFLIFVRIADVYPIQT